MQNELIEKGRVVSTFGWSPDRVCACVWLCVCCVDQWLTWWSERSHPSCVSVLYLPTLRHSHSPLLILSQPLTGSELCVCVCVWGGDLSQVWSPPRAGNKFGDITARKEIEVSYSWSLHLWTHRHEYMQTCTHPDGHMHKHTQKHTRTRVHTHTPPRTHTQTDIFVVQVCNPRRNGSPMNRSVPKVSMLLTDFVCSIGQEINLTHTHTHTNTHKHTHMHTRTNTHTHTHTHWCTS